VTGKLSQVTDRNGQVTTYGYDGDSRLTSITLPGSDVSTYGYDPLGRLVSAVNGSEQLQFSFDDAGRLVSQTSSGTGSSNLPTTALTYTYDAAGHRLSQTGPEGTTDYSYDVLGRLQSITDPSNRTSGFHYDSASQLTAITRPNGVNQSLSYDNAGELTSSSASVGGTTLTSVAYGYNTNGQRSSATDLTGTATYQYDPVGQLLSAVYSGGSRTNESYQYDAVGNRIASGSSSSFTYNADDQLLADPSFNYQYDGEGDLTQRTDRSTGATIGYDWNALHQLLAIHYPDGSTTSYKHDPLGRRVEVNNAGTVTRYAYDGSNIHVEYDGANTLAATYVDSLLPDSPLEMMRGGQSYYFLRDGLGSTTALTDGSGAVVNNYAYGSFGQQTSTSSVTNPFSFTGREYDSKSGLYYYRARSYDPQSGRFLSEDPVTNTNPYRYASNDPVNRVDPTGKQDEVEYAELLDEETLQTEQGVEELGCSVFYHYTTAAAAVAIAASGLINPGASGFGFFTPTLYGSGGAAQSGLSLPRLPDGYFPVPADRLPGISPPSPVAPNYGQPGGGLECTVTYPVNISGIPFIPF
jgi:RHS repeat-associated protein